MIMVVVSPLILYGETVLRQVVYYRRGNLSSITWIAKPACTRTYSPTLASTNDIFVSLVTPPKSTLAISPLISRTFAGIARHIVAWMGRLLFIYCGIYAKVSKVEGPLMGMGDGINLRMLEGWN